MARRILKWIGIAFGGVILLFVVWLAWGLYTMDDTIDEEKQYFGDLKGIEWNFRNSFHGKTEYPVYTLEQLRDSKMIDRDCYELIKNYGGRYTPFSPSTPDDTIVLQFNNFLFEPDIFTKRDLTADQNAPDHFVSNTK